MFVNAQGEKAAKLFILGNSRFQGGLGGLTPGHASDSGCCMESEGRKLPSVIICPLRQCL